MKRLLPIILCLLLLCGCGTNTQYAQVAATTLPVYDFTAALCQGTSITVTRLINEEVSCLHDYSLNVRQVKAAEAAEVIVISGAGLEEFMEDILLGASVIDASQGIPLLCPEDAHSHEEDAPGHEEDSHEGHHHQQDPHIWLSPKNAALMAQNICEGLCRAYPSEEEALRSNLSHLLSRLEQLQCYAEEALANLSCRELITFHDGFSYLADSFDLHILEAVEEESGAEASAKDLIALIKEVEHHRLPAIFTERSGSDSAASIISRETGAACRMLDMAMAGSGYFDAMYHNIDTLKEALQ